MRTGVALAFCLATWAHAPLARAADVPVSTAEALRAAFERAAPGDTIRIAPGTYTLDDTLWTRAGGEEGRPITVTADRLGDVRLDLRAQEGIVVEHPYWVLERLWIHAACEPLDACEAGIGVKPGAHHFMLRGSRTTNWYQHVKGSRTRDAEVEDASIIACELYNDVARSAQVIDIVGGKRWRIIGNYVHDFGASQVGDFGIFLKGATSDGLIERNLVLCAKDRPPAGASVGISLGQGGTGSEYCPNNSCACEDTGSVVTNNIVAHCTDTGLHARRSCGGKFLHNTVYDTGAGFQIQADGAGAPVEIQNNVICKRIYGAGTNFVASNNLLEAPEPVFRAVYASPDEDNFGDGPDPTPVKDLGSARGEASTDYCGSTREAAADYGAIEFPAGCATWPWQPVGLEEGPVDPGPDPDPVSPDPMVPDPEAMKPGPPGRRLTGTTGGCTCLDLGGGAGASGGGRTLPGLAVVLAALAGVALRRAQT